MDMTSMTILKENIDNNLWRELILAITYVKNNQPTRAIQNFSSYKTYIHEFCDLSYL